MITLKRSAAVSTHALRMWTKNVYNVAVSFFYGFLSSLVVDLDMFFFGFFFLYIMVISNVNLQNSDFDMIFQSV